MNSGRKLDTGKPRWDLVPFDAMRHVVVILTFGATKYAPRDWEKGMDWSRMFSAAMRHLEAWWMGEKLDPESGYPHLAHATCCLLFLLAYEVRMIGKDDRPNANVDNGPSITPDEYYQANLFDRFGPFKYSVPEDAKVVKVPPCSAHGLVDPDDGA